GRAGAGRDPLGAAGAAGAAAAVPGAVDLGRDDLVRAHGLGLLVLWWRSADEQLASSLTAADVQQLTAPFVAGFLLQVLFGAMSYLLPVTLRGGPRSTTAALAAMSRFAVLRVVTYNLALALFVLA